MMRHPKISLATNLTSLKPGGNQCLRSSSGLLIWKAVSLVAAFTRHSQRLVLLVLALSLFSPVKASDTIRWRTRQNRVDAQIEAMDLQNLLGRIATETGWSVFVEPDTSVQVSVKFKDTPSNEALKLLLGDLNYALVPQKEGSSRLYVFRTALQRATLSVSATATTEEEPKSKAIPNERIITLKRSSKKTIEELASELGAKVIGKIDGQNSYRLQFENEMAASAADKALAGSTDAESDLNYAVDHPARLDRVSSNMAIPFPIKPRVSTDTSQVIIGLIDTAVQTLPKDMNGFLLPAQNASMDGSGSTPQNQVTHGTSMAETILQGLSLAPKETDGSSVRILPVDIYGGHEQTTTFEVGRGIYTAINSGATVINLSLSGDGDSKFLSNMIADARKQGVLFFGAAGNEPTTAPTYPAAYPGVVAVTASDPRGNIAPYANRGSFVDVIAPGTSLVQFAGESYVISGTSASTAYVSGTAAGYKATGQSADQVEAALREALAIKPVKPKTGKP
ncbi:MAG: hypothetical protein EXS31_04460 [Pedosphaera sp.]|nr:hypothetical protein [Pedosphaera sp.]